MAPLAEASGAVSVASAPWEARLRASRVLYGPGRLADLGSLVAELGGNRILVVTDPGIEAAGHVATALQGLRAASLEAVVFDGVEENPTTAHVEAGEAFAREQEVDFLVGLGGGSAMDCAKGINFVLTNGGRIEDYRGFNRASRPMLSSVGVPCTAGTGSEAQSFALIAQRDTHVKMACGDEKVRFSAVILDPLLARTAPREVAAVAGFDALSHAVESFVTRTASPISRLFAREAWDRLDRNYETVVTGGADEVAWGEMLVGANLAGAAIEASMLGAAHACANPLTASFALTHGVAVAVMLPAVVRANGSVAEERYRELLGEPTPGATESLARRLESLRAAGGIPGSLGELGVGEADLLDLARRAAEQWTLRHNPRELGLEEVLALYRSVL